MANKSMQLQKKDVLILLPIVLGIVLGTYLWANHHQQLKRAWYWAQYPWIKRSIQCSDQAPAFMHDVMQLTVKHEKSMSNQLAYLSPNGQLFHCESGWEDGFLGDQPITESSRFRYASITKMITSTMILQLVEQKKLRLDQPILDILPIPTPRDPRMAQITVAMLLQHSAGFDRNKTFTPMLTMGKKPWCPTQIEELANVKLDFDPDTQFQYSNVGYCLLGAIIEQVSQQPYRAVIEQQYRLSDYQIKFVDNDFLADEIQYDYRHEAFYGDFWRTKFDFKDSLSAVGGLSGSAKQLALLTHNILIEQKRAILQRDNRPCAIFLWGGCYGYAMDPYQALGKTFTLYHRPGYFPGVETDLFVDDHGGVLVILRGATTPDRERLSDYLQHVYAALAQHYQAK